MKQHEMFLAKTYESGRVWACPICGRRFMFTFEPTEMIIIEEGDLTVSHYGSASGLNIKSVEVKESGG